MTNSPAPLLTADDTIELEAELVTRRRAALTRYAETGETPATGSELLADICLLIAARAERASITSLTLAEFRWLERDGLIAADTSLTSAGIELAVASAVILHTADETPADI